MLVVIECAHGDAPEDLSLPADFAVPAPPRVPPSFSPGLAVASSFAAGACCFASWAFLEGTQPELHLRCNEVQYTNTAVTAAQPSFTLSAQALVLLIQKQCASHAEVHIAHASSSDSRMDSINEQKRHHVANPTCIQWGTAGTA